MDLEQSFFAFAISLGGRDFEAPSGPLPEHIPPGRGPGFCVADTKAAIAADPSLVPCVGRAVPPGESEPVDHVWAVDAEGRVFDASWASLGGGSAYWGIISTPDRLAALKGRESLPGAS